MNARNTEWWYWYPFRVDPRTWLLFGLNFFGYARGQECAEDCWMCRHCNGQWVIASHLRPRKFLHGKVTGIKQSTFIGLRLMSQLKVGGSCHPTSPPTHSSHAHCVCVCVCVCMQVSGSRDCSLICNCGLKVGLIVSCCRCWSRLENRGLRKRLPRLSWPIFPHAMRWTRFVCMCVPCFFQLVAAVCINFRGGPRNACLDRAYFYDRVVTVDWLIA